jgi:ABC-type Fe3+/spermidine/putrescine transport system ATPase subunit
MGAELINFELYTFSDSLSNQLNVLISAQYLQTMMNDMALLTVDGIGKQTEGMVSVKDIYFAQQPLEKIAIAGETGSGKTTLLKMIAGMIQPDAGTILIGQQRVLGPDEQLIAGHRSIAYLSQYFELRNNYWVHELLQYANELTQADADAIYAICRIEHLLQRRTNQLSGGEKQRVALARLLTTSPKLLLLDEPFSNLDLGHKCIIKKVITDIAARLNISCIMTSHDAPDVLSWADMILVMRDGQIIQQGKPEQVYRQPVNEYCAALFGEYNLLSPLLATKFIPVPAVEQKEKQALIRPENISIIAADSQGVFATVQNTAFCGSYHTLTVKFGEEILLVNTAAKKFAAGDTVHLAVAAEDIWYV